MTKTFYCGNFTFKGYFIKAGTGWEIGYKFNNKKPFYDSSEVKVLAVF
jgi:nucleoside 2-deoxyribosyltransferase